MNLSNCQNQAAYGQRLCISISPRECLPRKTNFLWPLPSNVLLPLDAAPCGSFHLPLRCLHTFIYYQWNIYGVVLFFSFILFLSCSTSSFLPFLMQSFFPSFSFYFLHNGVFHVVLQVVFVHCKLTQKTVHVSTQKSN